MEADDAPLKTYRLLLLLLIRREVLTTMVLANIMPLIKWICCKLLEAAAMSKRSRNFSFYAQELVRIWRASHTYPTSPKNLAVTAYLACSTLLFSLRGWYHTLFSGEE
jgi:hypothetical protein